MLLRNGRIISCMNVQTYGVYGNIALNQHLMGLNVGMVTQNAAVPVGYGFDGIVPCIKGATMSTFTGIKGAGTVTAPMLSGSVHAAGLTGSGTISTAPLSLLIKMVADLVGSGAVTADMSQTLALAASLVGSGDVDAAMGLLITMAANLTGSGDMSTSNLVGNCSMSANITSSGDIVTADSCASAVWAKILSNSQTAEDTLLAAGSAGDPWIADLDGYGTGTAGKVMALMSKVLRNKSVTDAATGRMTVYDDDGVTPLLVANLYQDAAGTTPYAGKGAERRERLE